LKRHNDPVFHCSACSTKKRRILWENDDFLDFLGPFFGLFGTLFSCFCYNYYKNNKKAWNSGTQGRCAFKIVFHPFFDPWNTHKSVEHQGITPQKKRGTPSKKAWNTQVQVLFSLEKGSQGDCRFYTPFFGVLHAFFVLHAHRFDDRLKCRLYTHYTPTRTFFPTSL